jgi:hypothetical protein
MNVVPSISERNTLGIIYERGLIGIYHDWWVLCFWHSLSNEMLMCGNWSCVFCDVALLPGAKPSQHTLGHTTWYMAMASSVYIRTSKRSLFFLLCW